MSRGFTGARVASSYNAFNNSLGFYFRRCIYICVSKSNTYGNYQMVFSGDYYRHCNKDYWLDCSTDKWYNILNWIGFNRLFILQKHFKRLIMKKGYILFTLGCVVGLFVQQYVIKNQMGLKEYIIFIMVMLVFSIDKVWEVFTFLFLTSYVIATPFTWVYGSFKWYEPLLLLYILTALVYKVFFDNKVKNPLMVEEGDIERFPVVTETV